jgi:hypothetical protein
MMTQYPFEMFVFEGGHLPLDIAAPRAREAPENCQC